MKSSIATEQSRIIKKQSIETLRVFILKDEVYTKKGRNSKRAHVPLRWIHDNTLK